jgi:hypothetical protein
MTGPAVPARSAARAQPRGAGASDCTFADAADTTEESREFFERTMRSGEAGAGAAAGELFEALDRERAVSTALGARRRRGLVDDDGFDGPEGVAGARGEEQVERFGRGERDAGGGASEAGALGGGVSPVRMPTAGMWKGAA